MRRLLSITMFAVLLLPLVTPLLAPRAEAESGVPMCCRRDGKHHCMMGEMVAADAVAQAQRRLQSPREACPYQQRGLAASHHQRLATIAGAKGTEVLLHEPSSIARAECLRRISFDRSRQKRGPPALLG